MTKRIPNPKPGLTGPADAAPVNEAENLARLARELDKVRVALEHEQYDHAACLSIAEGAPLDGFKPSRPSHHAVIALRQERDAFKAELLRTQSELTAAKAKTSVEPSPRMELEKAQARVTRLEAELRETIKSGLNYTRMHAALHDLP